ncbi:MAG: 30S ribosomal protein S1 [Deltaproteobacteria bacterium]|nr:30S ribosomal protein S1 [Deltaproteobacteria bacterium]
MTSNPIDIKKNEEPEENFADLFESYLPGGKDNLQTGEQITGEIIAIGDKSVFVTTGTKIDGVIDKLELINEEGELTCAVGEMLTLYVVSTDDGEIRLSRVLSGAGGLSLLYDANKSGIPVEGRVIEECKGGFKVNLLGKIAFCPISQIDIAYVEKGEDYVGTTFEFLITRIEERGRNIVISRRDLLNRQMAAAREEFLLTLKEGDILEGRTTKIMPFGAFVSIAPGVEGMVHISELGWSHVNSVEDIVKINDMVPVKVVSIGEAPKDKNRGPKISLSMKQAQTDPWDSIGDKFMPGGKVFGVVTRCADFGAFVEIAPGLEGLVHISEMSYRKRIVKTEDIVQPGQEISVMIKSIDPENRRISLSIKDAEGDPWVNVESRYPVGQPVKGIIDKKEAFGFFIILEPGVTGLLPISKINASPDVREIDKLKTGDTITVIIKSVDPRERKISLCPADGMEGGEWKNFSDNTASSGSMGSLGGTLGEKLAAALKNKR